MRFLLLFVLAVTACFGLEAQSRPDCPLHPKTLTEMQGCYRPLLVFAASAADPRLTAQRNQLDAAADDMMDRDVLMVPILAAGTSGFRAPLSVPFAAPFTELSATEAASARKHYGVAAGDFEVVLLGEDGSAKLHSRKPVSVDRLNSLIDSMPTRKLEMQQPHAN